MLRSRYATELHFSGCSFYLGHGITLQKVLITGDNSQHDGLVMRGGRNPSLLGAVSVHGFGNVGIRIMGVVTTNGVVSASGNGVAAPWRLSIAGGDRHSRMVANLFYEGRGHCQEQLLGWHQRHRWQQSAATGHAASQHDGSKLSCHLQFQRPVRSLHQRLRHDYRLRKCFQQQRIQRLFDGYRRDVRAGLCDDG